MNVSAGAAVNKHLQKHFKTCYQIAFQAYNDCPGVSRNPLTHMTPTAMLVMQERLLKALWVGESMS
jgi:hypothetical protein